ncbi:MAG: hypothetical protein QOE61_5257, partial [Micromonosporaceae bacterium]|nr:hypothetical protein [Micromonosporaceae bacterium]
HAIRSLPLGNERIQIVLQARRDPYNLGYGFLQTVDDINSSRYAFGVDSIHESWTRKQESQHSTGFTFTGPETGGPGRHEGVFRAGVIGPTESATQSTTYGGSRQTTPAKRYTLFIPGRADRFGGDVEFTVSLTTTWVPSRLFNTVFLNVPHYIASAVQHAGDHRRAVPSRKITLRERVLIPHELIHHEILPEAPDGNIAAVEELPTGAAPTGAAATGAAKQRRPLITADDIKAGKVLTLGFAHEKLQILDELLAAKFSGRDLPWWQRSHAVARVIEQDTLGALHYMLSYQMFTLGLPEMLEPDGMAMPTMVREGGAWTDTYGDVSVQVEHVDPHVLGYFNGSILAETYKFLDLQRNLSRTAGISLNLTGGGAFNAGDLQVKDPVSPRRQAVGGSLAASLARHGGMSEHGGGQSLTHMDAGWRTIPWLRVSPDAIITLTLTARNERDWINMRRLGTWLGGGKVEVKFLVRHAAEFAFTPEQSIDRGLYHPGGIPVASGTFFPPPPERRPASTSTDDRERVIHDLVHAASSLPFLNGGFAVQIDWDGRTFLAGDRRLDVAELAAEVSKRLGELGTAPDPNVQVADPPPPGPVRLEGPDDPIVLVAPNAALIAPGQTISPAQAMADALSRPVLAPDSSYRITRDGAVLAVRQPAPDATVLGRGWQEGNWVAVFPRAQSRAPHRLGYNLADAISRARAELGWTLQLGERPALVSPPTRDVHYPSQTPENAIAEWSQGIADTHELAAAARELVPQTGSQRHALEDALDRADHALRALPRPPASLPAATEQRAAVWRDLARFRDAAADLGSAVAGVLAAAIDQWERRLSFSSQRPEQLRAVLSRADAQEPELVTALGRLEEAVLAAPGPSPLLPATAAAMS